jgi:hypothetical protein
MRLCLLHCPSCGAPIDVAAGSSRVVCGYCKTRLAVEADHVSTTHDRQARVEPEGASPSIEEPEATLWNSASKHFELALIEQKIPSACPELFRGVELGDARFAFVSLRLVDRERRAVETPGSLDRAFDALRASLEADGDPGLAANLALEALCQGPFDHALEIGIALFEPRSMRVVPYAAGQDDGIVWASGEEGRCIVPSTHREALERKMLRETADHFSNAAPLRLAIDDVVLLPSAGFVERGGRRRSSRGVRALLDVANAHLGEEPQRIVTLAKNAFWSARQASPDDEITGDVRVAAIRARPPALATALPSELTPRVFRSRRFEVAVLAGPRDALVLHPLSGDRHVLVWLSPASGALGEGAIERASNAIAAILDGSTGDNENPRRAGREAYEALGSDAAPPRMTVIQLFDAYGRVKYFRRGLKPPIGLGARGGRGGEIMAFDEGGEATVEEGARLFFPGALEYEGEPSALDAFADAWRGGKASRLYDALRAHWKTKKSDAALRAIALAARSDEPAGELIGTALVTGVRPA